MFWKISCRYRHNLCDRALSTRPNSTSPAFPSPLRSEDFASSWFFRKLQASPPFKKSVFQSSQNKRKAYRHTILQHTDENQTVDIAIRRLRKVAPDGMQRAQMLLKVSRIWRLVHDSNQVPISNRLVSVSKEGQAVKPTNYWKSSGPCNCMATCACGRVNHGSSCSESNNSLSRPLLPLIVLSLHLSTMDKNKSHCNDRHMCR